MKLSVTSYTADAYRGKIDLDVSGEREDEIFDELGIAAAVAHFGAEKLIKEIGEDEVKEILGINSEE